MEKLRVLIPKGRIFDNVFRLFADAGFPISMADRTYRPKAADWLDMKIMKPQNVGELLELGSHDAGFTGIDWIKESGANVEEIMDLGFDRVRIVAAVPKELDDAMLRQKSLVVATEYMTLAGDWLTKQGYNKFRLLRTYGATEVFPPDDADMIIDNTSTGQTLNDNGLRIVDTLLESSTRFVASKAAMADKTKRGRIEELAMLFRAVLDGRERVMLEMNLPKNDFEKIAASLPAMNSPTVSPLYGERGYAVKIAVKKDQIPDLIPRLKKLGATDIVEYDLRKVVP